MRLAIDAAGAVSRILKTPNPTCLLKEFADSAVNLELRFWIQDPVKSTCYGFPIAFIAFINQRQRFC